jgi:energy-coupling factor transporter ATP-binding protein EcfA2
LLCSISTTIFSQGFCDRYAMTGHCTAWLKVIGPAPLVHVPATVQLRLGATALHELTSLIGPTASHELISFMGRCLIHDCFGAFFQRIRAGNAIGTWSARQPVIAPHEAVQDGVGHGRVADPRMPVLDWQLAGDDGCLILWAGRSSMISSILKVVGTNYCEKCSYNSRQHSYLSICMKLIKVRVKNFRSVDDSGEFDVGDLTCLVGKNEAGKTAILRALHGLSPSDSFAYDKTRDYPRRYLSKFDDRHPDGDSEVTISSWELDDADVGEVDAVLGPDALTSRVVTITSYIGATRTTWSIPIDHKKVLRNLEGRYGLSASDKASLKTAESTQSALKLLKELEEKTPAQTALEQMIASFRGGSASLKAIDILSPRKPKFFYTSHFDRMSGEISINKLNEDRQHNRVSEGDRIFLDFLEYAGTTIEELRDAAKFEELVAQCEGASNDITDEIFEFWSQNEALTVKIELNDGRPADPPPFNAGPVAKIRIENKNHRVSVPLSERSAGFVWFFSFLAQFKQLKKTAGNAIILLDEPGLTLHGKAQSDLLRYIESRILPAHQVIYSTHSPFMVPAQRLADVRVVEDVVDYTDPRRPIVKGTKVSADVLSVDKDTLFPLQAHLGYEITQSLFVGRHCLLVEGPSDVVFLQAMSQALRARSRIHLDERWTICPTGGLDKVTSFASLFTGNKLDIAVLCDLGAGDKSKVERLRQSQILKSERVLTAADFTGQTEGDVEDLFDPVLYCNLVNQALCLQKSQLLTPEGVAKGLPSTVRIVKQVEAACRLLPADVPEFGHYVPAEWLMRNPAALDSEAPEVKASLARFETVFEAINQLLV